jgi:hypothetical protein
MKPIFAAFRRIIKMLSLAKRRPHYKSAFGTDSEMS